MCGQQDAVAHAVNECGSQVTNLCDFDIQLVIRILGHLDGLARIVSKFVCRLFAAVIAPPAPPIPTTQGGPSFVERWSPNHSPKGLPYTCRCGRGQSRAACTSRTACALARQRSPVMLRWAASQGLALGSEVADAAASDGRLDALDWLHTTKGVSCTLGGIVGAARNGHLAVVQRLCGWGLVCEAWLVCCEAAAAGYLDILEWMHTRGSVLDSRMCDYAAQSNDINVLRWLYMRDCVPTQLTWAIAARQGYTEVAEWLLRVRCPVPHNAVQRAAQRRDLVLLQLLDAYGHLADRVKVAKTLDASGWTEAVEWFEQTRASLDPTAQTANEYGHMSDDENEQRGSRNDTDSDLSPRDSDDIELDPEPEFGSDFGSDFDSGSDTDADVAAADDDDDDVMKR